MPLNEIQNLANVSRKSSGHQKIDRSPATTDTSDDTAALPTHLMKGRTRSQAGSPRDVKLKTWKLDTSTGMDPTLHTSTAWSRFNPLNASRYSWKAKQLETKLIARITIEAPTLTLEDVNSPLNMSQVNGFSKEQTPPDRQRSGSGRLGSSPAVRIALIPRSDQSTSPEPQAWSSAVGHASTGKSGRVIERLQGDIDRLHREKSLLKAKFEDSEKANETLVTRTQFLQDRNSNYEQSHEANQRALARKERQVEDLREELAREKLRTAAAQEISRLASESEENWRVQASQARSVASQKEIEYDTIVTCRNRDNDRHQDALHKLRQDFEALLRQREEDLEKYRKLEIIAEQQRQTIGHLDEHTKRLNMNFKAYRTEIDTAIADMRAHVGLNDSAVEAKLEEMNRVTGEMRWVVNVEKEVNKTPKSPGKKAKR